MARRTTHRLSKRRAGSKRRRRFRWPRLWPQTRLRRRWWRAYRRAPGPARVILSLALLVMAALAANWIYQVIRKPSELLFPVSGTLNKTPAETWNEYGPLFHKHSTAVMRPSLLAALAQVESAGNPIVRTYWRWSWSSPPLEIYRPASSAVGMYQITDGTFAEAKRYCVHHHIATDNGPWNRWQSCWFNSLYARVLPTNAVEMTSAYLDRNIANILERQGQVRATLARRQDLAAVIHLCGAGAGDAFARRGFRLTDGQRCGDHEVSGYLARVRTMQREFERLASAG